MNLPNYNADTIGQYLESALERIETLEGLFVNLPVVGGYATTAQTVTSAVDNAVKDVVTGVDAVTGQTVAQPAPAPAPAPVAAQPAPAPAPATTAVPVPDNAKALREALKAIRAKNNGAA